MEENTIFLFTELSLEIAKNEVPKPEDIAMVKAWKKEIDSYVPTLRKEALDILLGTKQEDIEKNDPCVTDYGAHWNSRILIMDYAKELLSMGLENSYKSLENNLGELEFGSDDEILNNKLKFLYLMRGPVKSCEQSMHSFSFSKSDYFFKRKSSLFTMIPKEMYTSSSNLSAASNKSSKMFTYMDQKSTNDLHQGLVVLNKFVEAKSSSVIQQNKKLFDSKNTFIAEEKLFLDNFSKENRPRTRNKADSIHSLCPQKSLLVEETSQILPVIKESDTCWDLISTEILSKVEIHEDFNVDSLELIRKKPFSDLYLEKLTESQNKQKISKKSGSLVTDTFGKHGNDKILSAWVYDKELLHLFYPGVTPEVPVLHVLNLTEFVTDVKFLLTGVSSETFVYTNFHFELSPKVCLRDVTPDMLRNISQTFMDIGDHYLKLVNVCKMSNVNDLSYGLVFKIFCKSIYEYLTWHNNQVVKLETTYNLMKLKYLIADLHLTMSTVCKICQVWQCDEKMFFSLPKGGQLLTYLYDKLVNIRSDVVKRNVHQIFKKCCVIYIRCVEDWLFHGHVDDKCDFKDFFVEKNLSVHNNLDRNFYLNLFVCQTNYVPQFLTELHKSIFNCGRYVYFLNLFSDHEDEFCLFLEKKIYPGMKYCLSEVELDELTKNFNKYEEEARLYYGGKTSVYLINLEEQKQLEMHEEHIKKVQRDIAERNKIEREEMLERAKQKKIEQNELLKEQIDEIEREKRRKKEEREEEEKKLQEEVERMRKESDELIEKEKLKMIKYYEDVVKNEEKRVRRAEWKKERLELNDRRIRFLLDEKVNNKLIEVDNLPSLVECDSEGNLIEEVWEDAISEIERETEVCKDKIDNFIENYEENANFLTAAALVGDLSFLQKQSDENVDVYTDHEHNQLKSKVLGLNNEELSDAERNKRNMIMQEYGEVLSAAQLNKLNILKSNFDADDRPDTFKKMKKETRELTEGEKNRERYRRHEFCLGELTPQPTPVKSNVLTDAQRNKMKVLGVEYDFYSVPDVATKIPQSVSTDTLKTPSDGGVGSSTVDKTELTQSSTFSSLLTISNNNFEDCYGSEVNVNPPPVKNHNYQLDLDRDKYFTGKNVELFKILKFKEEEFEMCEDFEDNVLKSFLIPLKVQEKLMNEAVMKHFLIKENLLSHLKSLRNFYFLHDGEFGRSLTNNLFVKLAECTEPSQLFERCTIKHIIQEALHFTVQNEPNSENLSFQINNMPPYLNHSSHDVLSPFELSYQVKWPLNIILTEAALERYNTIFHFLVKLKRMSWNLLQVFKYLSYLPKCDSIDKLKLNQSPHYYKLHVYRHAMTQFVNTLEAFISSHVLEESWINFMKSLESNEEFDSLYHIHANYVMSIMKRCFLTKNCEKILNVINSMIELSLRYYYTLTSADLELDEMGKVYIHPLYHNLKKTFLQYCRETKKFTSLLSHAIRHSKELHLHTLLKERLYLILVDDNY